MSAHAAQFPAGPAEQPLRNGLASALMAGASLHPQKTLLRDAGDRRVWCGRPPITWTYEAAAEIVGRLARGIGEWRLPLGSRIGLCFGGGAEASLAHLAVEAAGHVPCPLSPVWNPETLSVAVESAGLVAVLTEGRRGSRRPAEEWAVIALRHFCLRFIAAFGPGLPDGVISLDAMALERGIVPPRPGLGFLSFAGADPLRLVMRDPLSFESMVSAHRSRLPAAERILTLLPPHDLRGLATGLGLALASGATLETLVPFETAAFRVGLMRPIPTRLVVPASFEPALTEFTLPWTVRAIDVIHRAPARMPEPSARDVAGPPCLDALVFDEDALITRPRGRWEIPVVDDGTVADTSTVQDSLVARRQTDGRILFRAAASHRDISAAESSGIWKETAYRAAVRQREFAAIPAS